MDQNSDQSSPSGDTVLVTSQGQAMLGAPSSRGVSRRHLLMGCALLTVSGLAVARMPKRRYPAIDEDKFNALFPKEFGDWRTLPAGELVMPPESQLAEKLYEHILTRTYVDTAGNTVMFLVAYSSLQIDDVQLHRPEVCYAVSGFVIRENIPYMLKVNDQLTVPARIVQATQPLREETILYWTRVGSKFPLAWSGQRWAMMVANVEGFYPDGVLVRASIVNDGDQSVGVLTRFYRDLTMHISPSTKRLLYNV